jgi:hypothetical protein
MIDEDNRSINATLVTKVQFLGLERLMDAYNNLIFYDTNLLSIHGFVLKVASRPFSFILIFLNLSNLYRERERGGG